MPVRITNYHDYTVTVDGGDVRLKLARMTVLQFEAFNATYRAYMSDRGNPAKQTLPNDGETEEQVLAAVAAEQAYLHRKCEWVEDVLQRYVTVVEGDLVVDGADGQPEIVTRGKRFAELYATEASDVLGELWIRNGLSQKKRAALQLLAASDTGSSTAPSQADPGPRPATAAGTAESSNSAAAEDATGPSNGTSSGTTAPSS
jgi:hypothetical protein